MSEVIVVAESVRHQYAIIHQAALNDATLSFRARGILAYLLTRPKGWECSADRLTKLAPEGRDAIRSALQELEKAGHMKRGKIQGTDGRWRSWWVVYEKPQLTAPDDENAQVAPETGFQASVDPPPESQPALPITEDLIQKEQPADSRRDVETLCSRLADLVEGNGSTRPTITKAWRDAARLLLDKDGKGGRPLAEALRLIAWCQADEFWRANIMSMPTFRKQYDRLRLASARPASPNGRRSPAEEPSPAWMRRRMGAENA